jgi:hypothetical protein
LDLKLSNAKVTSRMNKAKVREELKWTGEETTFAETVNHFCQIFLFPKCKFLMLNIFYQSYLTVGIGIPTLIHFLYLRSAI